MSRNVKRRLTMPSGKERPAIVSDELESFSKKLHYALIDRDMTQSDLARIVYGGATRVDNRGYDTVVGRDRISSYCRGKAMPEPRMLQKIADALGMKTEELAPNLAASAIERELPEIQITAAAGHHETVLLKVNKLVPLYLAAEIAKMLSDKPK